MIIVDNTNSIINICLGAVHNWPFNIGIKNNISKLKESRNQYCSKTLIETGNKARVGGGGGGGGGLTVDGWGRWCVGGVCVGGGPCRKVTYLDECTTADEG